ncbi:hypothetical protein V6N13_043637 [Hibiscus sabdariffa]|uniref:Uncharacterized protein n=1 Tax=Hibiscus sabdariffa TaxID=183260 RepID=A0ABR2RFR0_9ROSI
MTLSKFGGLQESYGGSFYIGAEKEISARACGLRSTTIQPGSRLSRTVMHVRSATWSTPPQGCFKINTDVAHREVDGRKSCRGVVRDSNSAWCLSFSKFIVVYSILDAELWGCI